MSSLLVIGRLGSMYDAEEDCLVFNPILGTITDLGFRGDADESLSHRPPRPDRVPYDSWCQDRFFFVQPEDRSRSLGTLEVTEALVHDGRMRGEIDFTGFRVILSLRRDAYEAYLGYVGKVRSRASLTDQIGWDGSLMVRMPSRPFAFPMPRGSSEPWHAGKRVVGRLEPIKRFVFDEIEIQALRDEQGRRVPFDDAARDGRSGWQPALSLGAPHEAVPRWWTRLPHLGRE